MISAIGQMETTNAASSSKADVLHDELRATQAAFHTILDSISSELWRKKSPSCDWTYSEVVVHLTWALEYLPKEVESARLGRGMFNMPGWLGDPLSYWMIRLLARSATPQTIRGKYDRAMDAAIRLLDHIPEADWPRGANFYGEGFHSVERLFRTPAVHLAEHTRGWPVSAAAELRR